MHLYAHVVVFSGHNWQELAEGLGVEYHLGLPLQAALVGQCHLVLAAAERLEAYRVGVGRPAVAIDIIEGHHRLVEVVVYLLPYIVWRVIGIDRRVFHHLGQLGAVVVGMVFQDYALHVDGRVVGVAAKVEHYLYLRGVDALHVALPEADRLAGFQRGLFHEEEVVVVRRVGHLDGHAVMVGVGGEYDGEVVVLVGRERDVGWQVHLSLPLFGGGSGQ